VIASPPGHSEPSLHGRRIALGLFTVVGAAGLAGYAAYQASRVDEVDAPIPIAFAGRGGAVVAPGSPAPEIALPGLDGRVVSLKSFVGRPVWINVWASWCPPCRAEFPDIATLYQELASPASTTSLALMLISVGEAEAEVRRFVDRTRFPLPVLFDTEYRITESYRVSGLPTHFFVGADGTLRDFAIGGLKPRTMRARVERLISPP
jgi:thiol-disulfide isomerase/thioredoxin